MKSTAGLGVELDLFRCRVGGFAVFGNGLYDRTARHESQAERAKQRETMAVQSCDHSDLVGIEVRVLQRLGSSHVLVVHGKDGMDEVSLGAATMVGELKDGEVREYEIHPEDFGLTMVSHRGLRVGNAAESRAMLLEAVEGKPGPAHEIVSLNAGVALYAADCAGSIAEGIVQARAAIRSGAARHKLDQFVTLTRQLADANPVAGG